jgi:hypothetical protein
MVSNLYAEAMKGGRCAAFALMALKRSETLLYLYLLAYDVIVRYCIVMDKIREFCRVDRLNQASFYIANLWQLSAWCHVTKMRYVNEIHKRDTLTRYMNEIRKWPGFQLMRR